MGVRTPDSSLHFKVSGPDSSLHFKVSGDEDAHLLAEIRVQAMRPSLEALGRFDPQRARDRFLAGFNAIETTIVHVQDETAGFFVVRKRSDHLYLDHLYIAAAFQGQGIGRRIVDDIKREAQRSSLPIRLMALKDSPANGFYRSCGFEFVSAEAFDNLYRWTPKP
jgi:ribosomal protein S18 acetylase RimI-like enzyme